MVWLEVDPDPIIYIEGTIQAVLIGLIEHVLASSEKVMFEGVQH